MSDRDINANFAIIRSTLEKDNSVPSEMKEAFLAGLAILQHVTLSLHRIAEATEVLAQELSGGQP